MKEEAAKDIAKWRQMGCCGDPKQEEPKEEEEEKKVVKSHIKCELPEARGEFFYIQAQ